jgi:hypothetical protein
MVFARSSSLLPIQYAIITALTGDADLHAHVEDRVYDWVPENPTKPYIQVTTPTELPFDCFGCTDIQAGQRVTFTVHIWSTYRGSKETKEIAAHINDLLDHQALTVSGYDHIITQNTMTTDMRDPDMVHWHGVMYFTFYVMQS